ncbi:MAG: serine/threonine protein phosphatase [Treponema sp.]|jgi:UDP-2,3-diacylglucosamine pyrophosphatase LpxH|nr:serine/threonine protein phosphatase [Treponema sp.]
MPDKNFFRKLAENDIPDSSILDISKGGKVLVISDLHMGYGSRDDLDRNGEMVTCILEHYYFKNGWTLILNGDIEELQKYPLENIRKKWAALFRVFDMFAGENRLYKIIGNHDASIYFKRHPDYPYKLYQAVKVITGKACAYVFHGHQLSAIYSRFNWFIGLLIRYFLKPLGIKNISDSRNPQKRFVIEQKAYSFSMENHCLSIIGHTHRPLFESLGRFDYIKFEIERLCLEYPASKGERRDSIEAEVKALRKELSKLKRKEKRDILRQSLYGDELPVPCLFNSGCALGKKGINAIEVSSEDIALIYWFTEGKSKKFVTRGNYKIEGIPGFPYNRVVLNHNKLDYISAKIKLLGN